MHHYLETEVLTAPPQKLHLMLIEAAIRSIEQARGLRQAGQADAAGELLLRAQSLVAEMLRSLNPDERPDLARKMAGVYLFIFQSLVRAHVQHDEAQLADALQVLQEERLTWQQVCQQLGSAPPPPAPRFSLHA